MGILDPVPNTTPPRTSISDLELVPCITRGRSFCENAGARVSDGTQSQVTYFTAYAAAFDFASPVLQFANHSWNISGGFNGEVPGPPITITASVATDASTSTGTPPKNFVPVTFGNRLSTPLLGGHVVYSDPVPISWQQDEIFIVRTCVTAPLGSEWPLSWPASSQVWVTALTGGRDTPGLINGGDYTQTTSLPTITDAVPVYGPSQIFAAANGVGQPGILLLGDSISDGFADQYPGYQGALLEYEGFVVRALHGTGHGVVQCGAGGDEAAFFVQRGWVQARRLMATNCKHAVITMGRNDLTGGATAAALEPLLVQMWRRVASWGLTVWATTVPPSSTSTDNWITTTNQTTTANNAQRILVNAWLRGGAPIDPTTLLPVAVGTEGALVGGASGHPLAGTPFDVATPLETAQDSGIWAIDYTGTGTTHTSGTVTGASGTWTKGMLIGGPQIPANTFVSNVSGTTLTLNNFPTANQSGATIVSPLTNAGIHPSPQGYYLGSAAIDTDGFT